MHWYYLNKIDNLYLKKHNTNNLFQIMLCVFLPVWFHFIRWGFIFTISEQNKNIKDKNMLLSGFLWVIGTFDFE